MRVALVDYGSGNIASAAKALARAAGEEGEVLVTSDPETVRGADRIVLPGVGAFADCMAGLSSVPGLIEALDESVIRKGRPFLGICVGMQLMARVGREFGAHQGLSWIEGEVVPLSPADSSLKIPHMGWNEIVLTKDHPLFAGLPASAHAYFVHSFQLKPAMSHDLLATTDYGGPVVAAVGRDNLAGTQFHPEKSQAVGALILANFLAWMP